jgi:hypothetical protein
MGDSRLVKAYCEYALKQLDYNTIESGSYQERWAENRAKELQRILDLADASPEIGEVISIWDEPRPGYIRTASFAKWDGKCWVKYVPAIAKPKTLAEILSEIEKKED